MSDHPDFDPRPLDYAAPNGWTLKSDEVLMADAPDGRRIITVLKTLYATRGSKKTTVKPNEPVELWLDGSGCFQYKRTTYTATHEDKIRRAFEGMNLAYNAPSNIPDRFKYERCMAHVRNTYKPDQTFSANDVWDVWEAWGYGPREESKGTVGGGSFSTALAKKQVRRVQWPEMTQSAKGNSAEEIGVYVSLTSKHGPTDPNNPPPYVRDKTLIAAGQYVVKLIVLDPITGEGTSEKIGVAAKEDGSINGPEFGRALQTLAKSAINHRKES